MRHPRYLSGTLSLISCTRDAVLEMFRESTSSRKDAPSHRDRDFPRFPMETAAFSVSRYGHHPSLGARELTNERIEPGRMESRDLRNQRPSVHLINGPVADPIAVLSEESPSLEGRRRHSRDMHQALSESLASPSKSGSFAASRLKKKREKKEGTKQTSDFIDHARDYSTEPDPSHRCEKSVRSMLDRVRRRFRAYRVKSAISLSDIFLNIFVQSREKKNSAEIEIAGLFAEALRRIKSASPALKAEEDPAAPRERERERREKNGNERFYREREA